MTMMTAALVMTGGTLLAGKIASNRAKDPKAAIGSGTSPSLQPGEGAPFTPIEGSAVQNFGDFEYENMAEPELNKEAQEAQLLALLQEAGFDAEGLANLAFGGEVEYKAGGGGIGGLMNPEELEELLAAIGGAGKRPQMSDVIDFTSIAEPDLADTMVAQLAEDPKNLIADFSPEIGMPEEVPTGMLENAQIGLENFAIDNPEMFNAGLGALTDVLMAALVDMPERKGSMVRTQTLPGNAARRRNQLQNITPIGGSSVTFAKEGKVLKRPMFMPHGGPMNGPGGPKDDLIPVMASNGEYMLSKAAVDAAGNGSHAKGVAVLDKFNNMGNKRYGV
ncbi:MAG: hypothetical protein CBC57_01865 [Euryarchaeota archaeon TMED97]|nr:MAG: hypothetical protein CBC57_01865 [Euryarchaeota archaeon TMED97]|tara:strand:+ start:2700 stop:3701 length:1002 start_codon:yes stop_codon:yes gene_type:complete